MLVVLIRALFRRTTGPRYYGRVMRTIMLTWGANVVGSIAGGGLAESFGMGAVIAGSGVLIAVIPLGFLLWRPSTFRL